MGRLLASGTISYLLHVSNICWLYSCLSSYLLNSNVNLDRLAMLGQDLAKCPNPPHVMHVIPDLMPGAEVEDVEVFVHIVLRFP